MTHTIPFATDELMFIVPKLDKRLKNKDEVLGLIFSQYPDKPLAISVNYLAVNPLYHKNVGDINFVVLTDESGAARVYESKAVKFKKWDQIETVTDVNGTKWTLSESKLTSSDGRELFRLVTLDIVLDSFIPERLFTKIGIGFQPVKNGLLGNTPVFAYFIGEDFSSLDFTGYDLDVHFEFFREF